MADRVHPVLYPPWEETKTKTKKETETETEMETNLQSDQVSDRRSSIPEKEKEKEKKDEYLPSFVEKTKPPPGTYLIQIPKDQVFRVPPPENAAKLVSYTRRSASRRRRCCCVIIAVAAVIAVAVVAAAAAALYFVLSPKLPSYSLASLAINGLDPSSSNSPLSPDLAAAIRARNPNSKIGLRYLPGGSVYAAYDAVTLANGAWPSFYQGHKNATVFVTPLAGSGIRLSSSMRASMLTAQRNGAVPLTVDARVPVRFKVGAVTTLTWTVKLRCDVTVDELTANATVVSKSCHVKVRL